MASELKVYDLSATNTIKLRGNIISISNGQLTINGNPISAGTGGTSSIIVDNAVVYGSTNPVTSGAVFSSIGSIGSVLDAINGEVI